MAREKGSAYIHVICPAKGCHRKQPYLNKKCVACGFAIEKAARKKYLVKYCIDGREKSQSASTLVEARLKKAEIEAELLKGKKVIKDKNVVVTVSELLDYVLNLEKMKKKKSATRDVQLGRHLKRILGRSTIDVLTTGILEEYQEQRIKEPSPTRKGELTATATVDRELALLRTALNIGVEHKFISGNPIVRLPQFNADNSRDRVISHEEYEALMVNLPKHMQDIVAVGYWLGMRQGEILNLTWSQVDFKNKIISFASTDTKEKKKKQIPIFNQVLSVFEELPRGIGSAPVFLRNGKGFNFDGNAKRYWDRACKVAEVENCNFHDLRHTCITRMVVEGFPLSFIMAVTGHSNFTTHMRYCNLNPESLWNIIDKQERKEVLSR